MSGFRAIADDAETKFREIVARYRNLSNELASSLPPFDAEKRAIIYSKITKLPDDLDDLADVHAQAAHERLLAASQQRSDLTATVERHAQEAQVAIYAAALNFRRSICHYLPVEDAS